MLRAETPLEALRIPLGWETAPRSSPGTDRHVVAIGPGPAHAGFMRMWSVVLVLLFAMTSTASAATESPPPAEVAPASERSSATPSKDRPALTGAEWQRLHRVPCRQPGSPMY